MTTSSRPDPDALLASLQREEARAARGRLKIFFGMCPGVGKTYAMLSAARQEQKEGVDLVVGVVETHRRVETEALLEGLTVIPRRVIEYKGIQLTEMDLEAILARRPKLVLVDELAHTNAPGSRHPKRYQDVIELLDAGLNVYTTVNVQHIESRADAVRQITGAPVNETVPDSLLEMADEIELIDLTPEALLERLREGKVYLGDRAEAAARGFLQGRAHHRAARTGPALHRGADGQAPAGDARPGTDADRLALGRAPAGGGRRRALRPPSSCAGRAGWRPPRARPGSPSTWSPPGPCGRRRSAGSTRTWRWRANWAPRCW